jgi:hypothetical protein
LEPRLFEARLFETRLFENVVALVAKRSWFKPSKFGRGSCSEAVVVPTFKIWSWFQPSKFGRGSCSEAVVVQTVKITAARF